MDADATGSFAESLFFLSWSTSFTSTKPIRFFPLSSYLHCLANGGWFMNIVPIYFGLETDLLID
jgi:hypothetical protein